MKPETLALLKYWEKEDPSWLALLVQSAEPGSPTTQDLPMPVLVESLTRLALAIEAQTKALDKMAESNQGLIRAMAEDSGESDGDEPRGYLNARGK